MAKMLVVSLLVDPCLGATIITVKTKAAVKIAATTRVMGLFVSVTFKFF